MSRRIPHLTVALLSIFASILIAARIKAQTQGIPPDIQVVDVVGSNAVWDDGHLDDVVKSICYETFHRGTEGTLVVLADDLTLGTEMGEPGYPNVIILADRIHVKGAFHPNLNGRVLGLKEGDKVTEQKLKDQRYRFDGGSYTVIARRIEIAEDSGLGAELDDWEHVLDNMLKYEVIKKPISDWYRRHPGRGGHVQITFQEFKKDRKGLEPIEHAGASVEECEAFIDRVKEEYILRGFSQKGKAQNGSAEIVPFRSGKSREWLPSGVLNRWLERRLEVLHGRWVDADIHKNWAALRQLRRRYS